MANWGPKKMCPRSDKVGKLTGNEKHLVTACSSESRLRRVTGGGQLEKQRRSLWRLDSHGGAALLGCSHMSYEIGLSCWLGLGWDVHGGVGSAFFLEMSMFGPWSAHRHSMPRAVTWVPASLSTARLWPLCLEYFFFLPKGQILTREFLFSCGAGVHVTHFSSWEQSVFAETIEQN